MRRRAQPGAAGLDDRLTEVAVAVAIVGTPLAMGGRQPIGQVLLTGAAFLAVVACLLRAFARHAEPGDGGSSAKLQSQTPPVGPRIGVTELLALVAVIVGCLQLVPLPHRWLAAIAPHYDTLLPLWSGQPGPGLMGEWNRLSLAPGETFTGLGIFFTQVLLVLVVAQRARNIEHVERVLMLTAGITVALAVLGIAQYLAGNGKFLWVYEHVYADAGGIVKGTFSNRNHYASFLATGLGAVLWWALHPADPAPAAGISARRWHGTSGPPQTAGRAGAGLLAAAVVAFATLSSLSRGGTLALAAAAIVAVTALAAAGVVRVAMGIAIAAAGMLAAAALSIHGIDRWSVRIGDLFDAAFYEHGFSRLDVWLAASRAIADFPVFGTGIGSHAEVAPHYMPPTGETIFTHAESSYLNLGVETGLVGLGIAVAALLVGLAACLVVAIRGTPRERAVTAALASGLVASGVHATGDFVWYVPACSMLVLVFGACAVSLAANHLRLFSPLTVRIDRASNVILTSFCVVVLGTIAARQLAAVRTEPAWETALRENRKLAAAAAGSAEGAAVVAGLSRVIGDLEQVIRLRPDHPRAWALLSLARVERFGLKRRLKNNAATLVDLREAAVAADFSSRDELMSWLRSIAPDDAGELELAGEEARRAVNNCPLAGDAWCVLAALSFLHSPDRAQGLAFIEQAVLVRPADGRVLFEAGNQAALEGDHNRAIDWWRRSFASGPVMRGQILGILSGLKIAPLAACDLLAPDLDGLRAIDAAWSGRAAETDLREVRKRRLAAVLAATEPVTAQDDRARLTALNLEAAGLQERLGEAAAARESLVAALQIAPGFYPAHLALADHAIRQADWATARSEIDWCLLRRPDNQQLQDKLKAISRGQSDSASKGPHGKARHAMKGP
jgi:O-antigen ligase/tetratricopeptide (TPR) repeat protein